MIWDFLSILIALDALAQEIARKGLADARRDVSDTRNMSSRGTSGTGMTRFRPEQK